MLKLVELANVEIGRHCFQTCHDGSILVEIVDDDDSEGLTAEDALDNAFGEGTAEAFLAAGCKIEWTGDGNTESDGTTYSDILISCKDAEDYDDLIDDAEPIEIEITFHDSNPAASSDTVFSSIAIEVDSWDEAEEAVKAELQSQAAGLAADMGYSVGDTIWATWEDESLSYREIRHTLTASDLGLPE